MLLARLTCYYSRSRPGLLDVSFCRHPQRWRQKHIDATFHLLHTSSKLSSRALLGALGVATIHQGSAGLCFCRSCPCPTLSLPDGLLTSEDCLCPNPFQGGASFHGLHSLIWPGLVIDDAPHSLESFLQGKFSNLLKSKVTVPSPADVQGLGNQTSTDQHWHGTLRTSL